MNTDTRKVVSVMSFNSVMEAQLYKALLESAGIPARMQNDIAAQVVPAYGALMQVNLLVAEEDQKKAREILGAKFDIDDFHRQTAGPVKKTTAKADAESPEDKPKRGRKPGGAKKPAATKKAAATAESTTGKPAAKKAATPKKAAPKKAKPKKPGRKPAVKE